MSSLTQHILLWTLCLTNSLTIPPVPHPAGHPNQTLGITLDSALSPKASFHRPGSISSLAPTSIPL